MFQYKRENLSVDFLLFYLVAFIVHASIFCPRFSQKQSANQPKIIQENVLVLNSGTFEGKKFHPKKSLTSVLNIQVF